jgi:hypothetical protein
VNEVRPHTGRLIKTAFAFLIVITIAGTCGSRGASEEHLVLTYHAHPDRSGNFIVSALTWERARALRRDVAFHAQVSGHVYVQPLYWHDSRSNLSMLLVATEDNTVHALDARTGEEIWSRLLGRSVSLSLLQCGNIDPIGVTGTPVIDEPTASIFVDAMVAGPSGPRHLVFGISLRDGSFLPGWPVDVATALAAHGRPLIQVIKVSAEPSQSLMVCYTCRLAVITAIAANTMAGLLVFHCVTLESWQAGPAYRKWYSGSDPCPRKGRPCVPTRSE